MSIISILVPDGIVIVDGKSHVVDCSSLAGMQIVRWDGSSGTIEFASVDGLKQPPETFSDLSEFQSVVAAWASVESALPPPPPLVDLVQYAAMKHAGIASGGFMVNANASGPELRISVSTTTNYAVYLTAAVQLAKMMIEGSVPPSNINWVQDTGVVSLSPAQVITIGVLIASIVQQSFTVLGMVLSAIKAGTITTIDQIDTPPTPIPAWPVNS